MKFTTLTIVLSLLASLTIAQTEKENSPKKFNYGYTLGAEYKQEKFPLFGYPKYLNQDQGENSCSFKFGVMADYNFTEKFALTSGVNLAINRNKIFIIEKNNLVTNEHYENDFNIDIPLCAMYRFGNNESKPYVLCGPMLSYNSQKFRIYDLYKFRDNGYIVLGFGFEKAFDKFCFAPEIRYSYGMLNFAKEFKKYDTKFHRISLLFNFKS